MFFEGHKRNKRAYWKNVTRQILEPRYKIVALLELGSEVDFLSTHYRPICLPMKNVKTETYAGRDAVLTGWGTTAPNAGSFSDVSKIHSIVFYSTLTL